MAGNKIEPFLRESTASNMDATFNGTPIKTSEIDNLAIALEWTGTPTGSITLEGSVDYGQVGETATWVTIPLDTAISPAGADGTALIELVDVCVPYVRLVWTRSAGAGTLKAWVTGKEK